MSRKLKYRIISCSSQQPNYPASSLLFPTPEGWQTKRFCSYPQQITIQFYGIVHIDKLQLVSDSRKVASSVQILYFLPTEIQNDNRFMKYGFMQFNKNQNSNVRQQKTLMLDFKCLYIRLLFNKPHKSKQNFFSQVGLHQLRVFGSQGSNTLPLQASSKDQYLINSTKNYEQEDGWIYQKLMNLNAKKQKAIQQQDYQQANINKLLMDDIKKFGYKIRSMQQLKKKAIQDQDYDKAKQIKQNIQKHKKQIEDILSAPQFYNSPNQMEDNKNDFKENLNDPNDNQFVDGMNQYLEKQNQNVSVKYQNSRVSQDDNAKFNFSIKKKKNTTQQPYDQRVIPALTNKQKTQQDFDEAQEQQKANFQLQEVDGKYLKDASVVQQYFDKQTAQKIYSKHWQHKTQGLNTIQSQVQAKAKDAGFIKCMLSVVQNSIKQTNFQIVHYSLNILFKTLNANAKSNFVQKGNDLHTQLTRIIQQVIKKLAENNQKLKDNAEKCFQLMIHSNLYGAQTCCNQLMKSKGKVSNKLLSTKINQLAKIVGQTGIGSPNSAPMSVVDFAFDQLENPSLQVRSSAVYLIAVCSTALPETVQPKIQGLKGSYQQQIHKKQQQVKGGGGNKTIANAKKKKK